MNNRTSISVDLRQMNDEVLKAKRQKRQYEQLEASLRSMKLPNLNVLHVTYEDLSQPETWATIFRAVGREGAQTPKMIQSDYSGLVTNWPEVAKYSRLMGYAAPSFLSLNHASADLQGA
mmetsp:Transcript_25741/g.80006  ORF Transcript_25741/g.80006 Transcript_25741/m.80006 type:complete len:119 (-) Transcript_25741:55-411(-)